MPLYREHRGEEKSLKNVKKLFIKHQRKVFVQRHASKYVHLTGMYTNIMQICSF